MFIFKYILAEVNKIRQKLFKKYENSKKKASSYNTLLLFHYH